jgi:hypothetical protein
MSNRNNQQVVFDGENIVIFALRAIIPVSNKQWILFTAHCALHTAQ